jgi:methanogenic corrinoid protein MtbC1
VLYLGTEVPISQVAALARDLAARAVAVSVSAATKGPASAAALRRLREALPRRVFLVAGGDGAPAPRPGIDCVRSLRELDAWGRRATAGLPVAT